MSILKGILHHWNKTNSAYDTIHPETEVAQVTDWNQGIVNTLASTALGGLVNTLTSDSLLAKMIQKVLTATGVKYSLGQNGYVCLGKFFGSVIVQWGRTGTDETYGTFNFPIEATPLALFTNDVVSDKLTKGTVHIVTFNLSETTKTKTTYAISASGMGVFYWWGIFNG